jgi:hypothetical protein
MAMDFLSKLLQGIAFVPAVVTGIENLFGSRPGTEKKNAAISFVETALSMAGAIESREIVDEAGFKAGLSMVIDGVVKCLNASVWAKKPSAVSSQLSANPSQS